MMKILKMIEIDYRDKRIIRELYKHQVGPGSSVGIATGYGLDGPGIESRWG
jgi:hypothetical protein